MNLLYACTLYPPSVGGAQIHLHQLARQMRQAGHRLQVITHSSQNRSDWVRLATVVSEPGGHYVYEGVPVTRLDYSWWTRVQMLPWAASYYAWMPPAVAALGWHIRKRFPRLDFEPDLVHVSRVGREFLAQAALGYARQRKIPFVLTPNHHPRWHGHLYRQYDRIYRAADALIALTTAERDMLVQQKRVRPGRIRVTGIGPVLAEQFSVEDFRAEHNLPGRFVLFLGQQLPYKGIAALLDAARQVWRDHPDVKFVFAGPESDYSKRLLAGADPRVVNLGRVPLHEKTAALASCEVLCLPSTQESFGGVFVEAWSLKKPVIGCRIPAVESLIEHEKDGLLTIQSGSDLARAIVRLLGDPAGCRAMGQAGFEKVQDRYTWEKIAQKTEAIYRSLL